MDRLALSGLVLATAGALALIGSEIIGIAHASRPEEKTYFFALSSGTALHLVQRRAHVAQTGVVMATAEADMRRLSCARLIEVTSVSMGFRCRPD